MQSPDSSRYAASWQLLALVTLTNRDSKKILIWGINMLAQVILEVHWAGLRTSFPVEYLIFMRPFLTTPPTRNTVSAVCIGLGSSCTCIPDVCKEDPFDLYEIIEKH